MASDTDKFVQLLTSHQAQLRAFILSSLCDHVDTQDVLQRTNMVLWKKSEQFSHEMPFMPWALAIARYEILSFVRSRSRDRVRFHTDVVELMCDAAGECSPAIDDRQEALKACLAELSDRNRDLLTLRYAKNESIQNMSSVLGRSVDGVKSLLVRIRKSLGECIERKITQASG